MSPPLSRRSRFTLPDIERALWAILDAVCRLYLVFMMLWLCWHLFLFPNKRTIPMDPNAEVGILSWLAQRLREPSSYAGLGGLFFLLHVSVPPDVLNAVHELGIGLGAACYIAAFFLKEGKGKPVIHPAVKGSLVLFMTLAATLMLTTPGHTQQRRDPLTGDPVKDIQHAIEGHQSASTGSSGLQHLADQIAKLSLADFKAAQALAAASSNTITKSCWDAWVTLLESQQKPLLGTDGKPLVIPDPHLITDVEKLSELVQQLQPNSTISVGCSPMAQAVQKDIATLIGAVLSGGALGLVKLPFALP